MNVLFLSPWYPHRYDSMDGLFVQKHAEAVSLYADIKVLFVYADKNIRKMDVVINNYHSIEEICIYYPVLKNRFWNKFLKPINFFRAYRKGFRILKKKQFKPDIIHANVLTRTPFIAYVYKKIFGTPYVITEHWSRLLKIRDDFNGVLRNIIARIVVKNASYILPVSIELLQGLEYNKLLRTKYKIVENVVDSCFYSDFQKMEHTKKRILNVTCFLEYVKNIFGLLRTVKKVSEVRDDFELILVGVGVHYDETYAYYQSLNFPEGVVHFVGLKTSEEVAQLMQNADFVVQFSNYESAGVVVQEALVSGLPVISTKVGIASDYIHKGNGLLVDIKDENQLYSAIMYVLNNMDKYSKKEIKGEAADVFSYKQIGKKYKDIYIELLNE